MCKVLHWAGTSFLESWSKKTAPKKTKYTKLYSMSINGIIYVTKTGMWLQSTFFPGILSWYLLVMASVVTLSPAVESSLCKDLESIIIVIFFSPDSGVSGAKVYSTDYLLAIYFLINIICPCFSLAKKYLGKGCQTVAISRIWLLFKGKYGYIQAHNHVENVLHFCLGSAVSKHKSKKREKEKNQETKHFASLQSPLPSDK